MLNSYFIAIVLTGEIAKTVASYKQLVANEYASKAALNSPPHITLHMPFKKKEIHEAKICESLEAIATNHKPAELTLNNFDCFEPRVIFIHIENSNPVVELQKGIAQMARDQLNIYNSNYKDYPFHPHITVAFRDLNKNNFNQAWEHFRSQEINHKILCQKISLLKHNSKVWEVMEDFDLKG